MLASEAFKLAGSRKAALRQEDPVPYLESTIDRLASNGYEEGSFSLYPEQINAASEWLVDHEYTFTVDGRRVGEFVSVKVSWPDPLLGCGLQ